jgi:hypothetical protein
VRKGGTALYLTHESRKYLITARHVLHDEIEAEGREKSGLDKSSASDVIYSHIFRVPSLNELADPTFHQVHIDSLTIGAGGSDLGAYTFSHPAMDLAVISLSHRDTLGFAENLDSAGYEPITTSDVLDKPTEEGTEVFSVGYLDAVSTLTRRKKTDVTNWWSPSAVVSLPTLTFGRIALLHPLLPSFWADISIYPGSSGAPVIEGDKVVGIVIGQARAAVEYENEPIEPWSMRLPFAKCMAAGNVMELLDRQKVKDERFAQFRETAACRRSEGRRLASGEESD